MAGARYRRRWTLSLVGLLGLLGAVALAPASASGDPSSLPEFNGALSFPSISGPSEPDEFSWRVNLSPEQELVAIDEHTAVIYFSEDGTPMGIVNAESARDVTGAVVPTSLVVSEGDVVTLLVHHREGNPAAGGAPFAYPITPGPGFTPGSSTVIVVEPPVEAKPFESCRVPKLKGLTLGAAKGRLRGAGCRVSAVRRAHDVTARNGRVVRQLPRPGMTQAASDGVDVRLGPTSKTL